MDNTKFLRFNQRKQNFDRALGLLAKQSAKHNFDDENIAATLHFFEMTFELAWKLLKDFLEVQGVIVKSPRDAIKTAFAMDYIDDGHLWLEMLDARNMITHTYDENTAKTLFIAIKDKFLPALMKLGELQCMD